MDKLYENMRRQLEFAAGFGFKRYLYPHVKWDNRMLGIVGPRGVGKTTLLLQRILEAHGSEALYVTLDHMWFASHTLFDTAEAFNKAGGTHLFVDEVHKYEGWSRELKAIYDSFPDMHVYFTGSSVLDIERGEADLSRRAPRYVMQGLSFREYLAIRHGIEAPLLTLDQVLGGGASIPGVRHPLPLFYDYLRCGYYPFGSDLDFDTELNQVITRTLEVDIPQFANMNAATGRRLKKLMSVVSTLAPFKPSFNKLASQIQVSRNNVEEYLGYMEKAGMITQLKTGAHGIGALSKVEKVYLDNTNLIYCLSSGSEDIGSVRETFFYNQLRVGYDVTSSAVADFEVEGATFEIGGPGKTGFQVKDVSSAYVVKDGIEAGWGNVVPLWAFGLLY